MNPITVTGIDNSGIEILRDRVRENLENSEAVSTRRAHLSDWSDFQAWCDRHQAVSLPAHPDAVAAYISDLDQRCRPSTIQRRLATISVAHAARGCDSPTRSLIVRRVLKGIRNTRGVAKAKKAPLRVTHLRQLNEVLPQNLKGIRDKALLLIGFFGAFRRSELAALDVTDVVFVEQGARITVRRSKTDQAGEGHVKDISFGGHKELCPVVALRDWLRAAQISEGPVFRPVNRHGHIAVSRLHDKAVSSIIKEVAVLLKLDPQNFGGHSLRSGFVTDSLKSGIPAPVVKKVTGHRSDAMLGEYLREAELFSYNVTAKLGL